MRCVCLDGKRNQECKDDRRRNGCSSDNRKTVRAGEIDRVTGKSAIAVEGGHEGGDYRDSEALG